MSGETCPQRGLLRDLRIHDAVGRNVDKSVLRPVKGEQSLTCSINADQFIDIRRRKLRRNPGGLFGRESKPLIVAADWVGSIMRRCCRHCVPGWCEPRV